MNKLLLAFFVLMLSSCNQGQIERIGIFDVTFYFINDTDEEITIFGGCGFDGQKNTTLIKISARDEIILKQTDRVITIPPEPDTSNFPLFFGSCFSIYGDSIKCDYGAFNGIRGHENYEERTAISATEFEFTYRFTEDTMSEAGTCN